MSTLGGGYKFVDCKRTLTRNGWTMEKRSRTSHVKFRKDGKTLVISDGTRGVNMMLWRRLCKENNIKEEK